MANITPDYIRGFLVPFKFTSNHFWSDESSCTQNGSLAGIPSTSSNPSLQLQMRGDQTNEIIVQTERAGHVQGGAAFAWKYTGDQYLYGQEPHNKITDINLLQTPGINTKYIPRFALRLSSGTLLTAIEFENLTQNIVRVGRLTVDGVYNDAQISSTDLSILAGSKRYPVLCEMPDGSVQVYFWVISDNLANIEVYRSVDDGETWSKVSNRALPIDYDVSGAFGAGASGYQLQPIRVASSASQVLMLIALYKHNTTPVYGSSAVQYISTDRGLTFKYVDESSDSDASHFYLPDVVQYNGVFVISYISSTDSIKFTRIVNADDSVFDKLGIIPADTLSGSFATVTSNRLTGGDKTMYIDTDARLYLYTLNINKNYLYGAYSDLAGITVNDYASDWSLYADAVSMGTAYVSKFRTASAAGGGIKNICGAAGQGSQLLFCNTNAIGTNTYKDGLHLLHFGGWSTQQYPKLTPYADDNQWGYNTHDWIPFDLPEQNAVWTKYSTGTPSTVLGGDHIALSVSSSDVVKYYNTISDKSNGVILHTKVSNVTGGSVTRGSAFGVEIQTQSSAVNTYHLEIVVGNGLIYVYDVHAGYSTPLASVTGLDFSDGVHFLVWLDNATGNASINYAVGSSPLQYVLMSVVLTTATSSNQEIYWGIPTSSGTTRSSEWSFFSYGLGTSNGIRWIDGQINARQYPSKGFFVQIKDGLQLSTINGPARLGDQYTISPQYGSPVQRTLHRVSPSPKIGWRSDAVTNPDTTPVPSQTIAWMIDTTLEGTQDTHTMTEATGLHLTGINFREFVIQKYSSSAWSTVATIQNDVSGGFTFVRKGAAVYSRAASGPYLHLNECQGWSIRLDDGLGNVVQRRILSSGDGVLDNASSKKAYLHLSGVQTGDPTTGTAYLIPDSCTVLMDQNEYAGLRIVISSQKTAEGYLQIGEMVAGPLIVPGPQYGRGRSISLNANVINTESSNGTVFASKKGDAGRLVRLSWSDGVDTSSLNEVSASPSYYNLYSGSPIAVYGSAPSLMQGLLQYMDASLDAMVYLPSIGTLPSTPVMYNRYHDHILCTMGPELSVDHVLGDESLADNRGEVFRVSTVILREVR